MSERQKFDLQKALAGAPIETRDGRKARFIGHTPKLKESILVLYSLEGSEHAYGTDEAGYFFKRNGEHDNDLFMAPQKTTLWVNVYKQEDGIYPGGLYATSELARHNSVKAPEGGIRGRKYLGAYPVEIDV